MIESPRILRSGGRDSSQRLVIIVQFRSRSGGLAAVAAASACPSRHGSQADGYGDRRRRQTRDGVTRGMRHD